MRPKTSIDPNRRKIERLRQFHGGLIQAKDSHMTDEKINPFTTGPDDDVVTLSVYNRGE